MDAATAPVIVAARRTPIGTAGHALRDTTVDQLGAAVIRAVCDDLAALGSTSPVEQVVMGNCLGPGGNVARVSALGAGLPAEVPDRVLASHGATVVVTGHDPAERRAWLVRRSG